MTATAPTGRLIAVVGPSGVGKDSVMAGLAARHAGLSVARRVITRDAALGGEDFDAVTPDTFRQMQADGAFCLSWQAHDLHYGVPVAVQAQVAGGQDVLVNLSRSVLGAAVACFGRVTVLNLTASPVTLAARLIARGRETEHGVASRLARTVPPFALGLRQGLEVFTVSNDGDLQDTLTTALALLYPERE